MPMRTMSVLVATMFASGAAWGQSGSLDATKCNWITITLQSELPETTCAKFADDGWITRTVGSDCQVCDPDDLTPNPVDPIRGDPAQTGPRPVDSDETGSSAGACQTLRSGDKWYPGYTRCCDTGADSSRWTSNTGTISNHSGSCAYWGITVSESPVGNETPVESSSEVCRSLVAGEKYHPNYTHCCDTGSNTSRWTSSTGSISNHSGNCRSWGIR